MKVILPVPSGGNIFGEWLFGTYGATRAEVGHFEQISSDEDILRFDVAMKDAVFVHVIYRLKE